MAADLRDDVGLGFGVVVHRRSVLLAGRVGAWLRWIASARCEVISGQVPSSQSPRYRGGMLQVALVGDSHLTDTSTTAVTKLGPRLRVLGLRVVTHARGGMSSRDALLLPPPAPDCDWIVYCLGTNDAAPWNQVPPEEFAANYDRLLRVPAGPRKLVLGPPPVVERAEAGGVTNEEVGRYSVVAGAAARDHGALFTPLLELLDTDDLAEDGVHLNDNGYGKLAELVVGIMGADHGGGGLAVERPDHGDSRP